MSMARSSLKAGKRDFSANNRCFFLVVRDFMLTFAADKHNSITNKRKVARKNERNDNDNGQMPSGSKTKVKLVYESTGGLYLVVSCVL